MSISLLGAGQPSEGILPVLTGRTDMHIVLSLMKLNQDYNGSAIRIRRDSDNTEQDIGFSGTNLNTVDLLSFVGSANGYIRTIYDQSGNARNVGQTVSGYQPKLVNAGSILTGLNGKPAPYFDHTAGSFLVTSSTFSTPISGSVFWASKRTANSIDARIYTFGFFNAVEFQYKTGGTRTQWDLYNSSGGVEVALLYTSLNADALWHRVRWSNANKEYNAKFKSASGTTTNNATYSNGRAAESFHLQIGGNTGTGVGEYFNEMIILNADCGSTDFATIESDIQTRYSL